jgi:lysophospholipase L1-like esterase
VKSIFRGSSFYTRCVAAKGAGIARTPVALLVMLALLAVPYASPRLRKLRVVPAPWDPAASAADRGDEGEPAPAAAPKVGAQELRASENTPTLSNALPADAPALHAGDPGKTWALEDPTGHALDAFYADLARTAAKEPGAVTRILHYGDSVIASDYISGTMRRRFQERFGDAGHGFILIANPWQWYFHNDVKHWASDGWNASKLSGPTAPDGIYGLGGVSFQAFGGAMAYFGTADHGDYGRKASRFDVYYLEQPGGGEVQLVADNGPPEVFSTRGEAPVPRVHSIRVPDGAASLKLRTLGNARLFGVSLERDVAGVTYDALGAHAAMARYWKEMSADAWREQLDLRRPSLIVWQYGTNETDLWRFDPVEYEASLREVFAKLKAAAPRASIVVAAPMDRAERGSDGKLRTKPVLRELIEIERRVALENAFGFWNTFEAMGGEGSIVRWQEAIPQLAGGDLTHPTPMGAEVLGDMFTRALLAGFMRTKL